MDRLLEFFVNWLIVLPLLTLLHELGHAFAALYLSDRPVTIQLGSLQNGGNHVHIGRLTIVLAWHFHLLSPTIGFYQVDQSDLTIRQKVIVLLCGPLASLFTAVILGMLSLAIRPSPLAFPMHTAAMLAFLQFLLSAIPMTYPAWFSHHQGLPNDGKQIQNYHRLAAEMLEKRSYN